MTATDIHPELAERAHHNLIDFWRESPSWSSTGRLLETDSVLLYGTGSPSSSYRGAFRMSGEVEAEDLLDRADEFFLHQGLSYAVQVRDTGHDEDLRAACRARRMVSLGGPTPEMTRCAGFEEVRAPHAVELRQVTSATHVLDLSRVCAAAYGLRAEDADALFDVPERLVGRSDVRSVVAYLDGAAVAAGQMLMGHGVGGVYWVGVVDGVRRCGIGELVSRTLTNMAFERGARACTLQASSLGESVYRRIGYTTLYNYQAYWRVPRRGSTRPTAESA